MLKGFWDHVHDDHRKWNYIYYVLYVEGIPENDRNALEKYVYEKVSTAGVSSETVDKTMLSPLMALIVVLSSYVLCLHNCTSEA